MRRHAHLPFALALLAAASPTAGTTVIDNFESGNLSMSLAQPGETTDVQIPGPGHCIASSRVVTLLRGVAPTGPFTAELVPLQNVDDALVVTFPHLFGGGAIVVNWDNPNGHWDLTEGGTQNQIRVRIETAGPWASARIHLEDSDQESKADWEDVTADGEYIFPFSNFDGLKLDEIAKIELSVNSADAATVAIQNVETSNASTFGLVYQAWQPSTYTWQCGPRGGGAALGWDWAVGMPAQPGLAGPQLQIQTISGAGCAGVELVAEDSGGGGFGEVGLVTVDWLASSFDNGMFVFRFVTDPGAGYVAQPVGDPVVDTFSQGFRITQDIHVEGALGVPDGTVRHELLVAPVPGQEIWLDWVEAGAQGGPSEAGVGFGFSYTGSQFDPAAPLLEIYTTSSFVDDAGATGVEVAGVESLFPALRAFPSVTRAGTRFVLGAEPTGATAVEIFDVAGRLVRRLEARGAEVAWDARNSHGGRVPAGVYFGRLSGSAGTARVVLIR